MWLLRVTAMASSHMMKLISLWYHTSSWLQILEQSAYAPSQMTQMCLCCSFIGCIITVSTPLRRWREGMDQFGISMPPVPNSAPSACRFWECITSLAQIPLHICMERGKCQPSGLQELVTFLVCTLYWASKVPHRHSYSKWEKDSSVLYMVNRQEQPWVRQDTDCTQESVVGLWNSCHFHQLS